MMIFYLNGISVYYNHSSFELSTGVAASNVNINENNVHVVRRSLVTSEFEIVYLSSPDTICLIYS